MPSGIVMGAGRLPIWPNNLQKAGLTAAHNSLSFLSFPIKCINLGMLSVNKF